MFQKPALRLYVTVVLHKRKTMNRLLTIFLISMISVVLFGQEKEYKSKEQDKYYKKLDFKPFKPLSKKEILSYENEFFKLENLYMLKAVEKTAVYTIEKINRIKNQLEITIEKVKEEAPKVYRKELIELLFEQPYSKIEFVVEKLKIERKAASRYLKNLEDIGVLKSEKVGREILYLNTELIEILKH